MNDENPRIKMLYLYTTSGCHLCEQALEVIWPVLDRLGWRLQQWDIADSDELLERYGLRIPLVAAAFPGAAELGWPFDGTQLQQYLSRFEPKSF